MHEEAHKGLECKTSETCWDIYHLCCSKVMLSQASVILFTGGCLPRGCVCSRHTPRQTPPWADTLLGRHHPGRHPPGQTSPVQCMLWCTHPPGHTPQADTPWVDTLPLPSACLDTSPQRPLQCTVRILLECFLVWNVHQLAAFLLPFGWVIIGYFKFERNIQRSSLYNYNPYQPEGGILSTFIFSSSNCTK